MKSDNDTFAALPPAPRVIEIRGETLELTPITIGELPQFLSAVRPIASQFGQAVDWLNVFAEHGDALVNALAIASRRHHAWVADLSVDDAIHLAEAVLEVNADFFIQRLTPALLHLAGTIGKIGERAGVSSSRVSSAMDTTIPTS